MPLMGREEKIDPPAERPESGRCRDRRTQVVRRSDRAPAKGAQEAIGWRTFSLPALNNNADRSGSVHRVEG